MIEVGEGRNKPGSLALITVSYKGYFKKTEEVFDSGENVEIALNDPDILEGFKIAIESMRKNEKSMFTIKSKYAFKKSKSKLLEKFKEKKEELKKAHIVYDIKLHDFKKRNDLKNDGNLMKTIIKAGKGYRSPSDYDTIKITYEISQLTTSIVKQENIIIILDPLTLGDSFCTFIKDMKVGEASFCDIKKEYYTKEDAKLVNLKGVNVNEDIKIQAELYNFIRSDDYYNDKTTIKKTLKTGKVGTGPGIDCIATFKAKIIVDGQVKYSNLKLKELVSETKWEFARLSEEEDSMITTEEVLKYRLNEYKLPPIFTRNLKEMSIREVIEIETTKINKMIPYFPDSVFNAELVKDAKKVRVFIHLVSAETFSTLATLKLTEKQERILGLKENATKLFKAGHVKKACKIYQKINSYFNLGDITNLAEGESKDTEEYKNIMEALNNVKKQCHINAAICKFKLKDYNSTVSIADQALGLDENLTKAFYWKAKALKQQQEYDQAIETIKKAIKLEPSNQDIKNEHKDIIDARNKLIESEKKKYSKLFS